MLANNLYLCFNQTFYLDPELDPDPQTLSANPKNCSYAAFLFLCYRKLRVQVCGHTSHIQSLALAWVLISAVCAMVSSTVRPAWYIACVWIPVFTSCV
jgi:hypothetical protein